MGCHKLQLPDYFQLVENDPIKYRTARFIFDRLIKKVETGMMRVPPRQNDSLEGLSYSTPRSISDVRYFYAPDGLITAREINGIRQNYKYDVKNQLTAVIDRQGSILEQYTYDSAGNTLKKSVRADSISAPVVTIYQYDAANQLVASMTGVLRRQSGAAGNNALCRTEYSYDAPDA